MEHVSYIHKCTNKRRTRQHIRRKYKNCKHPAKQNEQALQRHMKLEILTSVKEKNTFRNRQSEAQTQRPLAEGQLIMRPITSTISKQQNQDSIRHSQPDSVMSTSTPGLAPAQPREDSGAMVFCQAIPRHPATQTQRGEAGSRLNLLCILGIICGPIGSLGHMRLGRKGAIPAFGKENTAQT